MSDNKDNKKKSFFARLFGGSDAPKESIKEVSSVEDIEEIPAKGRAVSEVLSKTALNKMKKADIVEAAKENGLDLDINLTKAKLVEAWFLHFDSIEDQTKTLKTDPVEDVPAEEEAPVEEAPAEEEAPVEEKKAEEETQDDQNKYDD